MWLLGLTVLAWVQIIKASLLLLGWRRWPSGCWPSLIAPYLAQRLGAGPARPVAVIGVIIALLAKTFNVQIPTGPAFAVAASANFPALLRRAFGGG